jgi:hypothetical protein
MAEKNPDVLLVGAGLTACAVAKQLDRSSIRYDWVAPALTLQELTACTKEAAREPSLSVSLSYSPKLSRRDYLLDQQVATSLLGRVKTHNFLLSRSIRFGGLANYWGANSAKAFSLSLAGAELDEEDATLLQRMIPTISIQQDPRLQPSAREALDHFRGRLQQACEAEETGGVVYFSEIALQAFPQFEEDVIHFNPKIIGNWAEQGDPDRRLQKGFVTAIGKTDGGYQIHLQHQGDQQPTVKQYSSLILCCGSIENLRLLAGMDGSLLNRACALQHHPIVSGFLWSFSTPPSIGAWPLSCFDLHLSRLLPDTLAHECYVNMIPAVSAIRIAFRSRPLLRFAIGTPIGEWFLSRLFVVNIYLPSALSASYIRAIQENGEPISLEVFGNHHPTIYSLLPAIKRRLRSVYRRCGMALFFLRLLPPGTDQHLSSSLNLCVDPMALVASPGHSVDRPLLVPDASTATIMPICNPTYAFALRAVRLVRSAVGKGLFAS